MGCSIHAFVEHLNPDTYQWDGVWLEPPQGRNVDADQWPKLNVGRKYTLFSLLARVPEMMSFSFFQRGFPANASEPVKQENRRYSTDGHSHSWLTREELERKCGYLMVTHEDHALYARNALKDFIQLLPDAPDSDYSRQRIVFWFDN